MNKQLQKKEGFTIIEVVLVLAIVGLIMLMIFIAWPALQRSQRDSARKNDVNTVASAISSYRGNNNGKNPTTAGDVQGYISNLNQYDKTAVALKSGTSAGAVTDPSVIRFLVGAKCGDDGAAIAGTNRQAAVQTALEAGGTPVGFCQDV